MESIFIDAEDGYKLDVHIFEIENPRAVVQVIHGMEEHQGRYEKFAHFLNENGFTVVTSDMRGHGSNAKDLGFFKDKDGYKELIEDQKIITKYIKTRYQNISTYIFAHSMGAIITRVLLQDSSQNYDKVILSGYPNYQAGAYAGILVANAIKLIKGPKYKSSLLTKLSIGQFNRTLKSPETDLDWISYSKENIESYSKDPICGKGFTCEAYADLFRLNILMHSKRRYKNVNSKLKLLLICGQDDPCTGGAKGQSDSKSILKCVGFDKIATVTYPNMRHEILNEDDKKEVYRDILNFYLE
ncbi:MAG TPA: hypothetical protein DCY94_00930 [Firmicutes bacterium]|nr:hypothetical protein [Bacillota bacterium]